MNILLIHPEFPETFWSMKHALKFIQRSASQPPLGLLTVAALLPADWNKRLVDLNVRPLTPGDLAWADYAFLGGMVVQQDSARRVIARCRSAGLPIVAGGPLFTTEHERFEGIDHFVLNEAEITLPRFLADLARGTPQHIYRSAEFADLAQSPPPMWELLDMKRYASMSIQYSRGCPFQCDFCNVTALFGRRPRTKTAPQVIGELDGMRAAGWEGPVFFVDDNLIAHKRNLRDELLPALIRWQRGKTHTAFNTQASINVADDPGLMAAMVQAGFDMVFVGIETPDERCLEECGKKQNENRNLLEDVKRMQRAGLQVQGGFIVGFDHDTPAIFQRQIDFIQTSGIVTAMVGMLQALAGTGLHNRLASEGRLQGLGTGDNVDGTTNILPAMGLDTLRAGYARVVKALYSPKEYYQRLRTFLREFHPPQVHLRPRLQYLMAFARSIIQLGVIGRERLQYWKLLAWTLLRRPTLLSDAVTLAICGHHYRRICERYIPSFRAA